MYDVFLSHSSLDKSDIVAPLVDQLSKNGLLVWYDNNEINKGEIIKEKIISGINESVVFVAVITNNFFQSNWASLELGLLQSISPNNLIPIISQNVKSIASQRYPFLFDHNYIEFNDQLDNVVKELSNAVNRIKQESGLWHVNKTNLKSLIKEMRSYNDFKLDQLAINLSGLINKNSSNNPTLSKQIELILDNILKDVAYRENIYLPNSTSSISLFLDIDYLSINMKEHVKFLNQFCQRLAANWQNSHSCSQIDLYLMQFSLFSIIEWYVLSYFKKPPLLERVIIPVAPEEFTYEDILQSYEIEKLVLPPNLIADPATVANWNKFNPLTFIGARDAITGKLVGFFNTLPISDSLYDNILSGDFDDTHIDIKDLKQYDLPGFYKLYLCSFCIHPAYNTTAAFKIIYNNFIDFLLHLATEREIFISDIIADGVTQKGANLCETIGTSRTKTSNHNSTVYSAKLIPPEYSTLKLNNIIGRRLIACYERIYTEYRDYFN